MGRNGYCRDLTRSCVVSECCVCVPEFAHVGRILSQLWSADKAMMASEGRGRRAASGAQCWIRRRGRNNRGNPGISGVLILSIVSGSTSRLWVELASDAFTAAELQRLGTHRHTHDLTPDTASRSQAACAPPWCSSTDSCALYIRNLHIRRRPLGPFPLFFRVAIGIETRLVDLEQFAPSHPHNKDMSCHTFSFRCYAPASQPAKRKEKWRGQKNPSLTFPAHGALIS